VERRVAVHYSQVLAELEKVKVEGRISRRKADELRRAFGARFTAAWKLVKEGRVKKYVFKPSGKVQWIVVGKERDYLIYEASGYCHCLLPDTPLVVKEENTGLPQLIEARDLNPSMKILDLDTESNAFRWTKVNMVWFRKSLKDIITVNLPEGFIQTTEDHKFYSDGEWKEIGQIERSERGFAALTSVPLSDVFSDEGELEPELAWGYGLFMADGYAGRAGNHRYSLMISKCDEDLLLKAKEIFEQYLCLKSKVSLSCKAGSVRGGCKATKDMFTLRGLGSRGMRPDLKPLTLMFRRMFYTQSGRKKVPLEVLNANLRAKEAFLRGFIAGDGYETNDPNQSVQVSSRSRVGLLGLQVLAKKAGWGTSFSYGVAGDMPRIIFYPDNTQRPPPHRKKRFIRIKNNGGTLVCDINTETHTFIASTFLVHNCNDFYMSIMEGKAKACKHLIAQRLACELGLYEVVEESDQNRERLMREWRKVERLQNLPLSLAGPV
jgi:predicted nucleic acid-binding Zn finger protein